MNSKLCVLLAVGILVLTSVARGQNSGSEGQNYGRGNNGGGGDDRDLASSIGVDRDALYEDMLRMQEEMGSADGQGPPPEIPEGLGGTEGEGGSEGQGSSEGTDGNEGHGDQGGPEVAEVGQGGLQGFGGLDDGNSEY